MKWLSGDEPQDRELLTSLSSKADISILLSGLDVLVIDEAQRIQGIGMLLKRLEDSKPSCLIFATGSSSLELAGGVMESAAGRLWPMTLFHCPCQNWPITIVGLTSWSPCPFD